MLQDADNVAIRVDAMLGVTEEGGHLLVTLEGISQMLVQIHDRGGRGGGRG